jgi:hypothetical protein
MVIEKKSPTDPAFWYSLIQKSDTEYFILFIGWEKYSSGLANWCSEYFGNQFLLEYIGWTALNEEECTTYDELYDVVYRLKFQNIGDSMQFKLIWG